MPRLAECDSSSSGQWVALHQTAMGLYVAGCDAILPRHWRESRLSTAAVGLTVILGDRAICVVGPEGVRTLRHYRLLGLRGTFAQRPADH